MKFETYVVEKEDGTTTEGKIAVPESLKELLNIYSEERIFNLGLNEYLMKAKKRLISRRSARLNLRVNDLSIEQQQALRKLGLLK